MCDDNCANLKTDRMRCDACRTINLASQNKPPKTDMQVSSKCPTKPVCMPVQNTPIQPTCFKVMTTTDYRIKQGVQKPPAPPPLPHIGHGKFMYGVKAGILIGVVYFTYQQRIWGDQQDVTECLKRWQEYFRSLNTRRPPTYDNCGRIVRKESSESAIAPAYAIYKTFITSCFAGVAKMPLVLKCWYINYMDALERKQIEMNKKK